MWRTIKREREREREKQRACVCPVNPRIVKRGSEEFVERSTTIQKPPSEKFSTNGSSKHRHRRFFFNFSTPRDPSSRFRRSISPSSQQLPDVDSSFSLVTLAHITNEHRAIPRNLYGRYTRRCHYLRLRASWSTRR